MCLLNPEFGLVSSEIKRTKWRAKKRALLENQSCNQSLLSVVHKILHYSYKLDENPNLYTFKIISHNELPKKKFLFFFSCGEMWVDGEFTLKQWRLYR